MLNLQPLVLATLFVRRALCLSATIPVSAPSTAPTLAPDLVSLSIEQDRWTDWAGTTEQNSFFFNTLDNLAQITGTPPRIRIGADSEDHTNFDPNVQFSEATFPAWTSTTPYPEASDVLVGDGFYQAAQFLPPNTRVTWGLNLRANNMTAAYLEAKSLIKAFSSSAVKNAGITLDSIEIGNEADDYGISLSDYVSRWNTFASNITAVANLSPSGTTQFWSGAFTSSSHSTTGFSPQGIFAQGMLSSMGGKLIKTISQHHYSGTFCSGNGDLLQNLMTKSSIRGNLTIFNSDISAVHAQGLEYILGETNSYSCHGAPRVSNAAGAAIWALDYALYAPQIGISRLFFHGGIGFKYNLIQPVTLTRSTLTGLDLSPPLAPHIQAQYYTAIIIAEAIGKSSSTRSIELSISDSRTSGYAFYVGNKLTRVVLMNSVAYLSTSSTRGSIQVSLSLTGSGAPTKMTIKRLFIPHADLGSGVTWGGQTYETSTGRVSGTLQTTTVDVSAGVSIQDSEAVLLSFQ
ncbi:hypothetical protein GALMADRAFT_75264 [Galerina marginata CBS 339.88]|uniref:Beta-glucuronidase C-terminal domain-containing protein n=1 Tax=Galerina marginata (strain CBS 339.88) TaxID=685588 RepID=A0A067SU27_GALM3|nr:hypothetical protein GALMADRAFT_75264 [Galerina marginata CBS 339.88]